MSEIIGDEPCPKCTAMGDDRTGNHLMLFSDGGKFCNRCNYTENNNKEEDYNLKSIEEITALPAGGDIPDRKLSSSFTELYGLRIEYDTTTRDHKAYYAPVHKVGTGDLLGYQKRTLPKDFTNLGNIKGQPLQFIGQHLARESGKFLIIVEGFLDTIAAKQMLSAQKKQWTVIGAWSTSLKKQFKENIEWLQGFDTIVLALDQDDAGSKAVKSVMGLLPPEVIKVATYSESDPCDMLIAGKSQEFVHSLNASKVYVPKGIVNALDVLPDFLNLKHIPSIPFPKEWALLNEKTDGMRSGEIIVYSGGTGLGKSALTDELADHLITNHKSTTLGILKMEHNNAVGLQSVFSVHLKRNLKKFRGDYTDEELTEKWNDYFKGDRTFLIDHGFSGVGSDSGFISKLVGLIVNAGCTDIIIDHLHAVISDVEGGRENETVDSIMYSLQRLAQMYQVRLHVVMHLRKTGQGGKSFETGEMPSLDDLKGSGALKQVPDTIIFFARDTQEEDDVLRRVATLAVGKNRWLGDTGIADKIIYELDDNKYYPFDYEAYLESKVQDEMGGGIRI